jgi:hypothetical protein
MKQAARPGDVRDRRCLSTARKTIATLETVIAKAKRLKAPEDLDRHASDVGENHSLLASGPDKLHVPSCA